MHKQLLLDVVKAIKERGEIEFNMGCWATMNCQTSGCAIGCYCLANPDVELKLKFCGHLNTGEKCYQPRYDGLHPTLSLMKYFDIEYWQSHFLFESGFYRTDKQEIEIIEKFIEFNGDIDSVRKHCILAKI